MNILRQVKTINNINKLIRFQLNPTRLRVSFQNDYPKLFSSQKIENKETVSEEPLKYFGSPAALWKAETTRSGGVKHELWYQPFVILGCLTVFLIYFCILREENDIDQLLGKTLYDHIEGLEETQLVQIYLYNKEHSLPTADIEKRMKELNMNLDELK